MATDQTIQLPADATTNKNLLRAFQAVITGNTTLEQVIILGDSEGNVVQAFRGQLAVVDSAAVDLLAGISEKLDILIDQSLRRS